MKNPIFKYVAATVLCLAASTGIAAPPMGPPGAHLGGNPMQMVARMSEQLELSEEQQDSVIALLRSEQEEIAGEREHLKELHLLMMAQGEEFDPEVAHDFAEQIGAATAKLAYSRAYTFAQIRTILDDDQRAKLSEMQERRKSQGKGRRERAGGNSE